MSTKVSQTDDAPRGETDLYGEPVAESGRDDVYYEAYSDDETDKLLIAKYVHDDDRGWVKRGLEKLSLTEFYDYARRLRKGE